MLQEGSLDQTRYAYNDQMTGLQNRTKNPDPWAGEKSPGFKDQEIGAFLPLCR
jgi:hypothetical protein